LRKEDASDKLVAMNIFRDASNLMHHRKCSKCLVFALEETYSVVCAKQKEKPKKTDIFKE